MSQFATVDALVATVEAQPYRTRCATFSQLGRDSLDAAHPDATVLQQRICQMAEPTQVHYHRLLAAYALRGAFAHAKQAGAAVPVALWNAATVVLRDPSECVAQLVMTPLLTTAAPPEEQPAAVPFSPAAFLTAARLPQFKAFVHRVQQCGQQAVLAEVYRAGQISDRVKRQYLLGTLTPAAFEQLPYEDQVELDTAGLRLLCHHSGAWVADFLTRRVQQQMRDTQSVEGVWQRYVQQAIGYLCGRSAAPHALALFTATAHLLGLGSYEVQQLLNDYFLDAFPAEVAHYLLDGAGAAMFAGFSGSLDCTLSRRGMRRLKGHSDLILRMMEKGILCPARQEPPHLPCEVRQRIYDTQRNVLVDGRGVMSPSSVEWLPRAEDRAAEARANYAHRELRDDPGSRIPYLRFLPFPEALHLGETFVTSNDVDIRKDVVRSLLGSLRYHPEHLDEALDFCLRRTKEQDPWKAVMYETWTSLPSGFWRSTGRHVPDAALVAKLTALLEATFNAKDISGGTLDNVQELLIVLVGPQPDFALPQLLSIIRKQRSFMCGFQSATTPFGYLVASYPRVLPRVATELLNLAMEFLRTDSSYLYVSLLDAFLGGSQKHVARVLLHGQHDPTQQAALRDLVKSVLMVGVDCKDSHAASSSFSIHYRLFPAETVGGLPALVEKKLDWVTQDVVQRIVCDILQGRLLDLLVNVIKKIPNGRFHHSNSKNNGYLCQLPLDHAYRWTANQQTMYGISLLSVIFGKDDTEFCDKYTTIGFLARLPSVSASTAWTDASGVSHSLLTLGSETHHDNGNLKYFALQALGHCEGDAAAISVLQKALDDPDMKMDALRAIARSLRRAPSAEAVAALEPVLVGNKVTAQKEALHLLGAKSEEAAYKRLVRFAADQHLPMPAVDAEGSTVAGEVTEVPSSTVSPLPMHRHVRNAFVAALLHYLHKPQVWAYFERLVHWDSTHTEPGAGDAKVTDEKDADKHEDEQGEEQEKKQEEASAEDSAEDEGQKDAEEEDTRPCLSTNACEALTKLPWTSLRLPWQVARYQRLLAQLLRHPNRSVRVNALEKLASVPPYASLDLCKEVSRYLNDCTNPRLVRPALQCMMRCTAEETVAYVASSILNVQADPSLKIVTDVFTSLTACADSMALSRHHSVVEKVVAGLIAARRQPGLVVIFIYALPYTHLVPQLTALLDAGLLHVGAAHTAVKRARENDTLLRDRAEVDAFEALTLRSHPCAVVRRIGLEVVLLCGQREGWTEERKAALAAYRKDDDLWVSSDASLVRMA